MELHLVDLAPDAPREAEAMTWLDRTEQRRWRSTRGTGNRRRFLLCRAALRSLLCARADCANDRLGFVILPGGKPCAVHHNRAARGDGPGIEFNVSHGDRHGLVALAPGMPVGVDIEERVPGRDFEGIARHSFSAQERRGLAAAAGACGLSRFYRIWTLKEALIKALGAGASVDATEIAIPAALLRGACSGSIELPRYPGLVWTVTDIGTPGFAAGVAVGVTGAHPDPARKAPDRA